MQGDTKGQQITSRDRSTEQAKAPCGIQACKKEASAPVHASQRHTAAVLMEFLQQPVVVNHFSVLAS